jgi:hypothetical protein
MPTSTAFVDSSAHPAAIPFYRLFPNEPIPGAGAFSTVAQVVDLRINSVEALLDGIGKSVKKGGSVVVVCHGNKSGISLTVGGSRGVRLEAAPLRFIRSNIEGRLDDAETAQRLKMGDFNTARNETGLAQLARLKTLIAAVHKLELDRVDLRACETGKDPVVLSQLQAFFNCTTLCCPKAFDSFGPVPFHQTTTDAGSWRAWLAKHPSAVIFGQPPKRFALEYKIFLSQRNVMLNALADSDEAVQAWTELHLPKGSYSRGPLVYHGLTVDGETMIWAGDAGYRPELVEAHKGKDLSTARVEPGLPQHLP